MPELNVKPFDGGRICKIQKCAVPVPPMDEGRIFGVLPGILSFVIVKNDPLRIDLAKDLVIRADKRRYPDHDLKAHAVQLPDHIRGIGKPVFAESESPISIEPVVIDHKY